MYTFSQHIFKQFPEIHYSNSPLLCIFINVGNRGGQDKLLPVWGSVWVGPVQQVHHTLTFPIGSVQEAARSKANTGRSDGAQPMCWKVRNFKFSNANLWFYIVMPEKSKNSVNTVQ